MVAATSLMCAMLTGRIFADEAKPAPNLNEYLERLQVKLDHAAQRANQPTASGTNVVGLRGASKQSSTSAQLYWKGKRGNRPITADEMKAFRSAVDQARSGKKSEAIAALNGFQEKYPQSALLPDVKETLHRLNASSTP